MADTDFILEHEILKSLYEKTSMYIGGYTRGDGKQIVLGKRNYNTVSLQFGILVDMMNNTQRYSDPNIAFNGFELFQNEIKTDRYSIGKVSNAIEVLVFNEHVKDEYVEHRPPLQSGSRKIVLTPKGAIDYRDNFYLNKNETDSLDLKIKKITVHNSKFQKWTPIISAAIAMLSIVATIFIARAKTEKPYIPVKEMQQLKQTQESINKSLEQYLDTLRVHQKQ